MRSAASVSVVLFGGNLGSRLAETVGTLDAQTLPYARYELIFIDPGSTDGTSARLTELATGRPNLKVINGRDGADGWRAGLEAAAGEYVLQLGRADRLQPFALETLLDRAVADDADVVLARSTGGGPIGYLPDLGLNPWEHDADEAAIGILAPCALIRRSLLADVIEAHSGWRSVRLEVLAKAARIARYVDTPVASGAGLAQGETAGAALADAAAAVELIGDRAALAGRFVAAHAMAVLRRAGDAPLAPVVADRLVELARRYCADVRSEQLPPAQRAMARALVDGDLSVARNAVRAWGRIALAGTQTTTRWDDGRLTLVVQGEIGVPGAASSAGIEEASVQLTLRNVGSSVEYLLDTDSGLESNHGSSLDFTASASFDPMTAATGSALERGRWQFLLRLRGTGVDAPVREAIPFVRTAGAVIDGEPISLYDHNGQLRLDVGATSSAFVGRCTPADATVAESAAGSLLTVRLPDVVVRGNADVAGVLLLGSFPLPGALRAGEGTARIECFVSGLAGVSKLSAKFGRSATQDLGLQLRISGSGDMAIEKPSTRPPIPKKTAAKKTAKKAAEKTSAASRPGPAKRGGTGKKSARKRRSVTSRLPAPLRPMARNAAKVPAVRTLYRRLRKITG